MKAIRYQFLSAEINRGTEEEPNIERVFIGKTIPYSEENLAIAKAEAVGGEVTVADVADEPEPTEPTVWDELDAAYQEGVNDV